MRGGVLVVGVAGFVLAGSAVSLANREADQSSMARLSPPTSVLPAGCRVKPPSRISPSSWALARQRLAPTGASAIRLCRYSGSEIIGLLSYTDGHAVTVSLGLTGCQTATNGSVRRTAAGIGSRRAFGPRLVAQLKRLTASPSSTTGTRPPAPLISTLGAGRSATLVSYCWSQRRPGGDQVGTCADGVPGHPAHTLRWRPHAPIIIDLRLPAHDVHVQATRIMGFARPMRHALTVHPRRIGQSSRRWLVHLPVVATRDNDLSISASFANGDVFADVGLHRSG